MNNLTDAAKLHAELSLIRRLIRTWREELERIGADLKNDGAIQRFTNAETCLRNAEDWLSAVATLEFPAEMMRLSLSIVRDKAKCEEVSKA